MADLIVVSSVSSSASIITVTNGPRSRSGTPSATQRSAAEDDGAAAAMADSRPEPPLLKPGGGDMTEE